MKQQLNSWPIIIASGQLHAECDDGMRLREIADELEKCRRCKVIGSTTYEDAWELFTSRADLGCVIVDWELPDEDATEKMRPEELVSRIRARNSRIPLLLLTDKLETENIPLEALSKIDGCLWKNADTAEFIAGRIEVHLRKYVSTVYPKFFGELV